MPKADTWELGLLNLLFTNATFANVGNATGLVGSSGAGSPGSLYLSLHTASPGDTGNQQTNEATYTGYTRIAVVRTSGAWTVGETTGTASAQNAAQVTFPLCTGGSNTITHVGIGTLVSGAGQLLYYGALASSLAVSNNITPSFAAGALVITED